MLLQEGYNFKREVLEESGTVLVDFWAPWCPPCRALNPTIHNLAREYKVCQVNIDNNPGLAGRYRVNAVPTLLVFREKVILFQQAGALPGAALEQVITQAQALDMAKVHAEVSAQQQK